jgi:hypothetical protein
MGLTRGSVHVGRYNTLHIILVRPVEVWNCSSLLIVTLLPAIADPGHEPFVFLFDATLAAGSPWLLIFAGPFALARRRISSSDTDHFFLQVRVNMALGWESVATCGRSWAKAQSSS